MKILNKIWGVSLLALLLIVAAPHISKAQDEYISEQDFYDELAPYGTWVSDPQYGDVWIPDVDGDFRPYQTQGHWVLTEYGNTWVSEYPWGWATFHYGRWRYDDFYGWEWIPGYEWAPAWVSWRHGGGYYGWAPLMPGISISLSFGSNYRVPDSYWAFAPEAYINRPNIYNYYVPHTRVVNIIRNTTIINNVYNNGGHRYIAGPRAADIQRYTHQRPRVYAINNASRPGAVNVQNNAVSIFRPAVRRNGDARPQRVVDANAYKQQNPNQGIARRGPGGAPGFNHENAARLANVARNANDNNNVVRINNRPNNDQQVRRPDQQSRRPDQQQNNRPNGQPVTQPAQNQPDNRPVFTPNRGGRSEDRPNVGQPVQTTPAQTQPGRQPVFNRGGGRNGNDNRPATNRPNNDLQQKQQQLNDEQHTLREQRRQQYQREQQLQSVGQTQQAPAINGQTPLQQQQDAISGQRRQLQRQQEQQQRAQQAQQVQQQAQQQADQQQRAQREQQRQAQQQQAQQQARQAQAQQAQQQAQQREQQRQAQQAARQQAQQQRGQQQEQQQEQRRPPGRRPN